MAVRDYFGGGGQILDNNGVPLRGGRLYFYEPGTATFKTTYTDSTLSTPNASPVPLNAEGRALVWLSGDYDVEIWSGVQGVGNAFQVRTQDNINPDTDPQATNFPGNIGGLIPNIDAGDTDHDLTVTVGVAVDSGAQVFIRLQQEITKQIDAAWTAGNDQGGLFSGTVAADTWYHFFLIRNPNTEAVDAGFDTSVSANNIPTGFTQYRRLLSVLTDGSANIIGFQAWETPGGGVQVTWDQTPSPTDWGVNNPGVGFDLRTCTVPPGYEVLADIHAYVSDANTNGVNTIYVIQHPDRDNNAANQTFFHAGITAADDNRASGMVWVRTNTNQQVETHASNSDAGITIAGVAQGWIDSRR